MPEQITGIGVSQALTELFALTGKLPLSLEGFIVPTVQVGDLDREVQWGPLAWATVDIAPPAGANQSVAEVALPVANQTVGLRAKVETIYVLPGLATNIYIVPSPGLAAPNVPGTKAWADTRKRGLPQLLLNGKNNAAGPGVVPVIARRVAQFEWAEFDVDWILGQNPDTGVNQGLLLESTTLLCGITVVVRWREGAPR